MEMCGVLFLLFISGVIGLPNPFYHLSEEEVKLLKRRQMECIEETRVDPDLVLSARSGNWKEYPNENLKKWALCSLMKAELMTAQGVYKIDNALSKVPPEVTDEVEDMIDQCLSSKALPAIDIAYNFVKCFHRTNSEYRLVSIM